MGLVSSLTHQQGEKKLEQYRYTYDRMGNKTQIEKHRAECFRAEGVPEEISRKLSQERGIYQYRYDKPNRLTEVLHGNETVSSYVYDAFGNRIQSKHRCEERRYEYNAANQLLRSVTGGRVECCQYDKRGNLTEIIRDDRVIYRYRYDETNRLAEAVNGSGQAVRYEYNGLGNRVGRKGYHSLLPSDPVKETEYLLDLTKPYHNLLERKEIIEGQAVSQVYTWDSNVVYATEGESAYLYLQDELGSPVRLVGVQEDNSKGTQQTVYGYDEFGNDLYGTQGEVQPFGYTGYQRDAITNTYFAQAREYLPKEGRFGGEDCIKGSIARPFTLNPYGYCWGNPVGLVDFDGKAPNPATMIAGWAAGRAEAAQELIDEARAAYDNQRVTMPATVFPEPTEDMPDYTAVVNEWLIKKEIEFMAWKRGTNDMAVMVHFYNQVKTGGPMDIKQKKRWKEAFGFDCPEIPFIYNGDVVDAGTLGNITYGYIGASLGYPDVLLYYGGGYANMKNLGEKYIVTVPFMPNYGDAPEDIESIKKGIDLYHDTHKLAPLLDCVGII